MKVSILPSLLSADMARLGDELRRVAESGADAVHLDIMDGHFVPNISYGPDVVAMARRVVPGLHRHVHLMLTNPERYVEPFARAGAETIQIHVEAACDVAATLRDIRARGIRTGLVVRPQTSVSALYPYLELCDEVLFMTVNPGYGGQAFMAEVMPHIREFRAHDARTAEMDVMIDGGVNYETAEIAAAAGVNQFVAGSFLFKQADMEAAIAELRRRIAGATR